MAYGRRGGGRRGGGGMRRGGRRGGRRAGGMPGGGRIRGGHSVPSTGIYMSKGAKTGLTARGKGQDRMQVPHGTGSFRDVTDGESQVRGSWTNIRTPAGFQASAVSADQQFLQRQFQRAQRQQLDRTAPPTAQARPQRAPYIMDPSNLTSSHGTPYSPSTTTGTIRGSWTNIIVAPSTPSVSGSLRVPKVKRPPKGKRWPTPQAEMWGILGVDVNAPALDLMDTDEAAQVDPETPRTAFAVLLRGPYVLLLRRSKRDRWQPGKWSLPGGHVNGPETLQDGVAREVLEEAGLAIATPLFHPLISFTNKRGKFVSFFAAHAPSTPVCRHDNEHDLFAWVHPEDLWKYPLAPNVMTAIGFALGINPKLLMKRQRANQEPRTAIWRKVRV